MSRLNWALAATFAVSVAANFTLRYDASRPNTEYLPEMVHSAAYDSFAPNPNFADGKTMQAPPEGAVPRRAPIAVNDRRGAHVFQSFCTPCHGGAGKGDGPVVARGYPAPPSLFAENAMKLTDEQMFQVLAKGQKNMPSYASQIGEADRWAVIHYVRGMQKGGRP